jgi:hypothetical protein
MKRLHLLQLVFCIVSVVGGGAFAQSPAPPSTAAAAPTSQPAITVAILDFDANTPSAPDLGKQIGEALTAILTGESGFQLVDRASMHRTLEEHQLGLTGLVNPDQAAQIGKLVGAKILVVGKCFPLDKQIFVTAKIIGTETSLVEGILVKGNKDAETGTLVAELSQKLADRLRTSGPKLVAPANNGPDPLTAIQEQLRGKALPKVGIAVTERHVSSPERPIDPAVDTELKMILNDAGFTVIIGDAKDWQSAGCEVEVTGESFSEAATRIGNIVSCSARAEVKLVNRKDNKLLKNFHATARAADLSEQIAAKTALQKAGHAIGIQILEYYAKNGPAASQP